MIFSFIVHIERNRQSDRQTHTNTHLTQFVQCYLYTYVFRADNLVADNQVYVYSSLEKTVPPTLRIS